MNPTPADSNKVDDPAQGRLGFLAALGGLSLVWLGTFVYPLYQYLSPPPVVFGFSGYLLPWDDLSFFATRVGISEVEKAPGLGMWLANLVRGGGAVTVDTIGRFYPLHVVVMPLVLRSSRAQVSCASAVTGPAPTLPNDSDSGRC